MSALCPSAKPRAQVSQVGVRYVFGLFTMGALCLQSLKAEFEQHEALLRELEKQVEEYRNQGKTEAADRLQQQIHILKVGALCLWLHYVYGDIMAMNRVGSDGHVRKIREYSARAS